MVSAEKVIEILEISTYSFMAAVLLVFTCMYIASRTANETKEIQESYLLGIVSFGTILFMLIIGKLFL